MKVRHIVLLAALASVSAHADAHSDAKQEKEPRAISTVAASTQTAAALSDGEIRKVDKDAKKLTIRHGPLVNLDMPAMTMVFQVQDAAMLDQVKPGDKVKFEAQKIGGAYTVTRIEPAPY
jgi:Cu(I)/Ag(I) efflux system periplasmic protein CusF